MARPRIWGLFGVFPPPVSRCLGVGELEISAVIVLALAAVAGVKFVGLSNLV